MEIQNANFKNLHLQVSVVIVFFVALTYGIFPEKTLQILFDFKVQTVDLKSVFRTLMCLYFGMITLWIFGILKSNLWQTATISNIVFMVSLAVGRILSLVLDGFPSNAFLAGLFIEVLLAYWGFQNIKKYSTRR